jgi:hypothetical protein
MENFTLYNGKFSINLYFIIKSKKISNILIDTAYWQFYYIFE